MRAAAAVGRVFLPSLCAHHGYMTSDPLCLLLRRSLPRVSCPFVFGGTLRIPYSRERGGPPLLSPPGRPGWRLGVVVGGCVTTSEAVPPCHSSSVVAAAAAAVCVLLRYAMRCDATGSFFRDTVQ